jgi:hypothetical protein
MSLFRLDKNYFDSFKILTKPQRTFFSGSDRGLTGSIKVFPMTSLGSKEVPRESADDSASDETMESTRLSIVQAFLNSSGGFEDVNLYMEKVNSASVSAKRQKAVEILRFEPSFKFTSDTLRKRVIQRVLFPFYRPQYGSTCNWAFTNYHTLNFFATDPLVDHPNHPELTRIPSSSVLMYPAMSSSVQQTPYRPTGSFSFEFYINPRYSTFTRGGAFHAGTLFHMSSSFALSLVSGSSKDVNGYTDGFRLLLQLSSSADISPSEITLDSSEYGPGAPGPDSWGRASLNHLVFSSSNNSLKKNHWHYCCVRWARDEQNSTGSFFIDGENQGEFVIRDMYLTASGLTQSGSWLQQVNFYDPHGQPDALFVGNYYAGPNNDAGVDESYIAQFFNPDAAYTDGIENFYPTVSADSDDVLEPSLSTSCFSHPLQAEVHELKIYGRYRDDGEILSASVDGIEDLATETFMPSGSLMFYLPPFFMKDTATRDIFQTPFQTVRGSTDDPFNVPLSFGVGGHYLNLENFTKELVHGRFPRLFHLTASTIDTNTGWQSCNYFLFSTGSTRKRNLTILPNDNGRFSQNYRLLKQAVTQSSSLSLFVNDRGEQMLSLVSLNNLLPTGSIGEGLLGAETAGSISEALAGATPDDPSIPAGSILTIYNRTRDASSNEVSFFDASNLFYGNRIDPGSYVLQDSDITGSEGRIKITLRDNGTGNLYRADATGSHATWSSVGTLLYDEGLAIVKTPTIPRFGKEQFKVDLVGNQNIHTLRISVPAEEGNLDLSVNPTYQSLSPSGLTADAQSEFCYITNVNFLDENLNVICKSNFSQAIVKRVDDRFVVRVKLDF